MSEEINEKIGWLTDVVLFCVHILCSMSTIIVGPQRSTAGVVVVVTAVFYAIHLICCQNPVKVDQIDYPDKIPGNCTTSDSNTNIFDCVGTGQECVPLSNVRDCVRQCSNGADEACPIDQLLCETRGGTECGRCVSIEQANATCRDRLYSRLCAENDTFICRNKVNCFHTYWIMDGENDCFDNSDEDPCFTNRSACDTNADCAHNLTTNVTVCTCRPGFSGTGRVCFLQNAVSSLLQRMPGNCTGTTSPLFDCGNGVCIELNRYRDCNEDCPDGVDESCFENFIRCDGCKCVSQANALTQCKEFQIKDTGVRPNLCGVQDAISCVGTSQVCVFQEWLLDGANDCGDLYDEDACANGAAGCSPNATCASNPRQSSFSCTCDPAFSGNGTECISGYDFCQSLGQFNCPGTLECLPDSKVLDGNQYCSNGKDETYCQDLGCGNDTCAYNTVQHEFGCGCPSNTTLRPDRKCYELYGRFDCAALQQNPEQNDSISLNLVDVPNCVVSDTDNCKTEVYCDFMLSGGGWTIIQHRKGSKEDFFRTWSEYKRGFGQRDSDGYWIGNQKLYEQSSSVPGQTYELLIQLVTDTGEEQFVEYDSFAIQPESDNYRLLLGALKSHDEIDNLEGARNQSFGTWDFDTDQASMHCGTYWRSGWWFEPYCAYSGNLNVPYDAIFSNNLARFTGITWQLDGKQQQIAETKMMMRPKGFGKAPISDCASIQKQKLNSEKEEMYDVRLPHCTAGMSCSKKIRCDFETDKGGWTYIQHREDDGDDFWRSWKDYKTGFGNESGNYWAGNEFVYQITGGDNATYELMITVVPCKGATMQIHYDAFSVASEAEYYKLTLGSLKSPTSNASALMSGSNGKTFGTYDKYAPSSFSMICGVVWRSGWWFQNDCLADGNLNVPYNPEGMANQHIRGLQWQNANGQMVGFIKEASMKIRPANYDPG